jgi:uncharacterized protein YjiS (DUF1127 family)
MSTSTLHVPLRNVPVGQPGAQVSAANPFARGTATRTQSWFARLNGTAHLWARRARARRELRHALTIHATLGRDGAVRDLGATSGELLWEARKPFWRA